MEFVETLNELAAKVGLGKVELDDTGSVTLLFDGAYAISFTPDTAEDAVYFQCEIADASLLSYSDSSALLEASLAALAAPGSLDAGKLLGLLKAQQTYLERLDKLNRLDPAQKQDADGLWMFTKEVEGLSNEKLAAIFQKFNSPEMDLLQTALMREGQINPQAKDARMAASRLFNVQALVLKEIGNRAARTSSSSSTARRGSLASLRTR